MEVGAASFLSLRAAHVYISLLLRALYASALKDDRTSSRIRRAWIDTLHVGVVAVFWGRQPENNGAPRILKNRCIVQQCRKRVRAERIGFSYHDVRSVNNDSIPDGMYWARSTYLVHRYF